MSLWEAVSKRSKKFKNGDCSGKWRLLKPRGFTIGSLMVLAKEGCPELYEQLKPKLNMTTDAFNDGTDYKPKVINTPYLLAKEGQEENRDQRTFRDLTNGFMQSDQKCLVVRSRYGSGKTTFLQELIQERNPQRVLFITYRQTLARDIMRNFSRLGFKNYLDSYEDPEVWNAPRLIVQLDSLWNVMLKNDRFIASESFDFRYDLIVLDESESLLNHFDG